jgi:hypothetical protein
MAEMTSVLNPILSSVITALTGLGGVLAGAYLVERREQEARKYAFVQRRLDDFYGPLLGFVTALKMRELGYNSMMNRLMQLHETASNAGNSHDATRYHKDWQALADLQTSRWKQIDVPAQRQIVEIFQNKSWLGDPDTDSCLKNFMMVTELNELESGLSAHQIFDELANLRTTLDEMERCLRQEVSKITNSRTELRKALPNAFPHANAIEPTNRGEGH